MTKSGIGTGTPGGSDEPRRLAARIVSAYVSNNSLAPNDLPALIAQVYGSLRDLGRSAELAVAKPEPAVPIRRSVTPDWIICLEDGRQFKMLKGHLQAAYGLTLDQYRERWGLPADYPVVAPNFARQRSALAKAIGLGTQRTNSPSARPAPAPQPNAPRGVTT
ncbi:MAG: MucR family transcriptional regulator [Inquilinus sp.]|uniref:MucR family transcriptional regulator n=1 Tax=Inquilinus sp. TaxID=1932117 RepID=UPI003F353B16